MFTVKADGDAAVLDFEAEAPTGSRVLGSDIRSIIGYSRLRAQLLGLDASKTTDKILGLVAFELQVFVNGQPHLAITEKPNYLPKALPDEGTPIIDITPKEPWKPLARQPTYEP